MNRNKESVPLKSGNVQIDVMGSVYTRDSPEKSSHSVALLQINEERYILIGSRKKSNLMPLNQDL